MEQFAFVSAASNVLVEKTLLVIACLDSEIMCILLRFRRYHAFDKSMQTRGLVKA